MTICASAKVPFYVSISTLPSIGKHSRKIADCTDHPRSLIKILPFGFIFVHENDVFLEVDPEEEVSPSEENRKIVIFLS